MHMPTDNDAAGLTRNIHQLANSVTSVFEVRHLIRLCSYGRFRADRLMHQQTLALAIVTTLVSAHCHYCNQIFRSMTYLTFRFSWCIFQAMYFVLSRGYAGCRDVFLCISTWMSKIFFKVTYLNHTQHNIYLAMIIILKVNEVNLFVLDSSVPQNL